MSQEARADLFEHIQNFKRPLSEFSWEFPARASHTMLGGGEEAQVKELWLSIQVAISKTLRILHEPYTCRRSSSSVGTNLVIPSSDHISYYWSTPGKKKEKTNYTSATSGTSATLITLTSRLHPIERTYHSVSGD